MSRTFRRDIFTAAIAAKLAADGLSVRKAARQAGVSASVIERATQIKAMNINTFVALIDWMDTSADQFIIESEATDHE